MSKEKKSGKQVRRKAICGGCDLSIRSARNMNAHLKATGHTLERPASKSHA